MNRPRFRKFNCLAPGNHGAWTRTMEVWVNLDSIMMIFPQDVLIDEQTKKGSKLKFKNTDMALIVDEPPNIVQDHCTK